MKNKLTIGFVLDDTLDRQAGAQNYILTIGDYLASQGHNIHYIVGETNKKIRSNQHSLAKNINVSFSGNKLSVPMYVKKSEIYRLLDSVDFDILHIQVPCHPLLSGKIIKAASKKNIPLIGTYHILPYSLLSYVGNVVFGMYSRKYNKYFSHWINITDPSRKFSSKYYGIDGDLIFYPINQKQIDSFVGQMTAEKSQYKRLLFHGRLVERKGCDSLLNVLGQLNKMHPALQWRLDISGDGPDRTKLEAFAASHNIADYVTFHGRTSERRKFELMREADYVIYPAKSGESFGVVIVEALATNKPVVLAGNNPGYSSVLHASPECLFDPSNTNNFRDLLLKACSDESFYKKQYALQQALVGQYDIVGIADRLVGIYEKSMVSSKYEK